MFIETHDVICFPVSIHVPVNIYVLYASCWIFNHSSQIQQAMGSAKTLFQKLAFVKLHRIRRINVVEINVLHPHPILASLPIRFEMYFQGVLASTSHSLYFLLLEEKFCSE